MEIHAVGVFENQIRDDSRDLYIFATGTPTNYHWGNRITAQNIGNFVDYDIMCRRIWAFDSPEPDSNLIQSQLYQKLLNLVKNKKRAHPHPYLVSL